jgi:hypothetical protein
MLNHIDEVIANLNAWKRSTENYMNNGHNDPGYVQQLEKMLGKCAEYQAQYDEWVAMMRVANKSPHIAI